MCVCYPRMTEKNHFTFALLVYTRQLRVAASTARGLGDGRGVLRGVHEPRPPRGPATSSLDGETLNV